MTHVHPHASSIKYAREKADLTEKQVADHFNMPLEKYQGLEKSRFTIDFRAYIPIITYLWRKERTS